MPHNAEYLLHVLACIHGGTPLDTRSPRYISTFYHVPALIGEKYIHTELRFTSAKDTYHDTTHMQGSRSAVCVSLGSRKSSVYHLWYVEEGAACCITLHEYPHLTLSDCE